MVVLLPQSCCHGTGIKLATQLFEIHSLLTLFIVGAAVSPTTAQFLEGHPRGADSLKCTYTQVELSHDGLTSHMCDLVKIPLECRPALRCLQCVHEGRTGRPVAYREGSAAYSGNMGARGPAAYSVNMEAGVQLLTLGIINSYCKQVSNMVNYAFNLGHNMLVFCSRVIDKIRYSIKVMIAILIFIIIFSYSLTLNNGEDVTNFVSSVQWRNVFFLNLNI